MRERESENERKKSSRATTKKIKRDVESDKKTDRGKERRTASRKCDAGDGISHCKVFQATAVRGRERWRTTGRTIEKTTRMHGRKTKGERIEREREKEENDFG